MAALVVPYGRYTFPVVHMGMDSMEIFRADPVAFQGVKGRTIDAIPIQAAERGVSTVRSPERPSASRARQALRSVPALYARFCTTTLVFRFDGVSANCQHQQAIAGA